MNWIEHEGILYNLDKFTQICRGDDNEIVLSTETHSGDWDDEKKCCSLLFKSKDHRDLALDMIMTQLETLPLSGKLCNLR